MDKNDHSDYSTLKVKFKMGVVTVQQTREAQPISAQCWPIVCDAVPTLSQHWLNVSCLLGVHTENTN